MNRRLFFEDLYQGKATWEIGRPQPSTVKLAEAGRIRGSVLEVGCATGENLLHLAARGHEAWGVDFVQSAIEQAKAKAAQRGIEATFIVGSALELDRLDRQFDTVIDCGLFQTFTDNERPVFVKGLAEVLRSGGLLHILCFSDEEPGTDGPRRIAQHEIRDSFHDGWEVQNIEPAQFESVMFADGPNVSRGARKAWLATIKRN